MDEFDKYLWDMDTKRCDLYNQYIDNLNHIDRFSNEEEVEEIEKKRYEDKVFELDTIVRNKMTEGISIRYNLEKELCEWIVEQLCFDCFSTFGAGFLDAKRYASIAKFALDKPWKKES